MLCVTSVINIQFNIISYYCVITNVIYQLWIYINSILFKISTN
jgi:hypothetical protein